MRRIARLSLVPTWARTAASAVTEDDRSEEVLALQQRLGYIPAGPHVSATLARLRQLPITCLATMHGSALCGANIGTLFTALEQACGTISGH